MLADSNTGSKEEAAETNQANEDDEEDPRKLLFELKHAPKHATCQTAHAWSTTEAAQWDAAAPRTMAHVLWEPRDTYPLASSLSQAFANVEWARVRGTLFSTTASKHLFSPTPVASSVV